METIAMATVRRVLQMEMVVKRVLWMTERVMVMEVSI
jgi:hypothetical protein